MDKKKPRWARRFDELCEKEALFGLNETEAEEFTILQEHRRGIIPYWKEDWELEQTRES